MNAVEIKIVIDGKEANATLVLTKDNVDAIRNSLTGVSGKKIPKDGLGLEAVTKSSGNARMSVISLSQTFQDATMFQQGFRMGMMSIGNNVDQLVTNLVQLRANTKLTGQTMTQALTGAISGPTGVLMGVSLLIAGLQVLPGLFHSTNEAAKKAADDGLEKFSNALKKMSTPEKQQTAEELKRQVDLLEKAVNANLKTIVGQKGQTATVAKDVALDENLRNRLEITKKLLKETTDQLAADKAIAAIENEGNQATASKLKGLAALTVQLAEFRKMQDDGIVVDSAGVKIADRIQETQRQINLLHESTSEQLKKQVELAEAQYKDHGIGGSTLRALLVTQLGITKELKAQYEIKERIRQIDRQTPEEVMGAKPKGLIQGNFVEEQAKKEEAARRKRVERSKFMVRELNEQEKLRLQQQEESTKRSIELIDEEAAAKLEATQSEILAGAQAYDSSRGLGEQMKEQTRQTIKRIIAEAVATQLGKVIATIPFPFNLIAAPAAGLAVSALLENLIPQFATGGRVTNPTLAMLGERGPELAIPEYDFLKIAREDLIPKILKGNGSSPINLEGVNQRLEAILKAVQAWPENAELKLNGRDLVAAWKLNTVQISWGRF